MPTPEEIKSIAREYARCTCIGTFDAQQRAEDEKVEYDFALPVLEWLSQRYCLVEKSEVKAHYKDVCEDIRDYDGKGTWGTSCTDMVMHQRARGMKQMLYRLFGKQLFEEDNK